MSSFRRVEDRKAGPTALGILVPPGLRTRVIVRPRALPWDLLPGRIEPATGSLHFCIFGRDEAVGVGRSLFQELERQAAEGRQPLEVAADGAGRGFLVWLCQNDIVWIACARRPGQPYQEVHFARLDEAEDAARQITAYVCPGPDAGQEVYFNTQHFQ